MEISVEGVTTLQLDDGGPVRAASAVVAFGGGWLVAQDDATFGAWVRDSGTRPVRLLPAIAGHDVFEESEGLKHLKPDLEAGFEVPGSDAVVLLGSGSSPRRRRAVLVRPPVAPDDDPRVTHADVGALQARAARVLGVADDLLNLEGACAVGGVVRWFQRGLPSAGVPTGSVDVDLAGLLALLDGDGDAGAAEVGLTAARHYDLGEVDGVGLGVTDAVVLAGSAGAGDGHGEPTLLVSAAAEDTADPREDGPVVGSVLAVLVGERVVDRALLPRVDGAVLKVEGLVLAGGPDADGAVRVLATVDADDPDAASLAVRLRVTGLPAR